MEAGSGTVAIVAVAAPRGGEHVGQRPVEHLSLGPPEVARAILENLFWREGEMVHRVTMRMAAPTRMQYVFLFTVPHALYSTVVWVNMYG